MSMIIIKIELSAGGLDNSSASVCQLKNDPHYQRRDQMSVPKFHCRATKSRNGRHNIITKFPSVKSVTQKNF